METLSTESTDISASTASTEASGSAPASTETAQATSSGLADTASASVTPAAEAAPPAYTPTYKFKVMDKEHEIPDFLRPAITSAEHEKQLKEIYEKAFGLDEVKSSRDKVREEFKSFKSQTEPMVKTITEASRYYQSAIDAFKQNNPRGAVFKMEEAFKHLGIPDSVLQQYVFQKLNMEDVGPELKADYNRQREQELQFAQMQQTVQEQQQYMQQLAVQTRTQELQAATSRPEVASIVQDFDQRNGPGSFHQEVISRGQFYWQTRQQDVPPDQLVQEIITKYGLQAPQAAQPQAPLSQQAPPVIPVVKGSTGSPAGKTFHSLEDLTKHRIQQYGS